MVEHAPVKRRVVGSSPAIPVAFGRMHELKQAPIRKSEGSSPSTSTAPIGGLRYAGSRMD